MENISLKYFSIALLISATLISAITAQAQPSDFSVKGVLETEAAAGKNYNSQYYSSANVGKIEVEAILKDIQRHPFKPKLTHLDFQRVDATHKLTTKVPLHFIGEEIVTKAGATVVHQLTDVEISCLPKALPEFIEVNVSELVAGDSIHISDLQLPAGVASVELGKGEGHDLSVVTIKANKAAPAEDEEASDAAE